MPRRALFEQVIGTDRIYPGQVRNSAGQPETGYDATTPIWTSLWREDGTAAPVAPEVEWIDAAIGTYVTKIARTDIAGQEPGICRFQGFLREVDGDEKNIFDVDIRLNRGPGTAFTERIYNTYEDMIRRYSPLLRIEPDPYSEPGWAEQRADAAQELEDLIVDRAPADRKADVRSWIESGKLVVTERIKRIATYKSLANILAQQHPTDDAVEAGRAGPHQSAGKEFERKANEELDRLTAEFNPEILGPVVEIDVRPAEIVGPLKGIYVGWLRRGRRSYRDEL